MKTLTLLIVGFAVAAHAQVPRDQVDRLMDQLMPDDCDAKVCLCPDTTLKFCFGEQACEIKKLAKECGLMDEPEEGECPMMKKMEGAGCMLEKMGWMEDCMLVQDQIQHCFDNSELSEELCPETVQYCFDMGNKLTKDNLEDYVNAYAEGDMEFLDSLPVSMDGATVSCDEIDFENGMPKAKFIPFARNIATMGCLKYAYSKTCSERLNENYKCEMTEDPKNAELTREDVDELMGQLMPDDCDAKVCLCPDTTLKFCFGEQACEIKKLAKECGLMDEPEEGECPMMKNMEACGCMLEKMGWMEDCMLVQDQIQHCFDNSELAEELCPETVQYCFDMGNKLTMDNMEAFVNAYAEGDMEFLDSLPVSMDGATVSCADIDFENGMDEEKFIPFARNLATMGCLKHAYSETCSERLNESYKCEMMEEPEESA